MTGLIVTRDDGAGVREIVLSRPKKRNALTPEMLTDLAHALEFAGEGVRAVVLTGEGPAFCAGFDLTLCEHDPGDQPTLRSLLVGLDRVVRAMRALSAPVVVCCHGAAVAGGCAIVCGGDIVVADDRAKLGYPVVRLGISPAVSVPGLGSMVAPGAARSMFVRPDVINAERARSLGLVHEVVQTPEAAIERAGEIARALAAKPSRAMHATKAWLNELTRFEHHGGRALGVSTGLLGMEESRTMLGSVWARG